MSAKLLYKKAFTMIEMLIVIALMSLLFSIWLTSVSAAREKGRDAARFASLQNIRVALELYYLEHKSLPQSAGNPVETSTGPSGYIEYCGEGETSWTGTSLEMLVGENFIPSLPTDPVNTTGEGGYCFIYQANDDAKGACMWTLFEGSDTAVGIVVGEPSGAALINEEDDFPKGYQCDFLDEVIGVGPRPPPSPPETASRLLSVQVTSGGNVSGNGIDCQGDSGGPFCYVSLPQGQPVTLNAEYITGYAFAGWSDATCYPYAMGNCSFTLDTDITVYAVFEPEEACGSGSGC